MSVTRVFALHNNYAQSGQQGICTAASLDWCKKTLKAHHEKEFFDIETGLFRARLTGDLKKKMNDG